MVNTGSEDERQAEIDQLRATATNLSQCLNALQQRMDELEIGRNETSSKTPQDNHTDDQKFINDGPHTSDVQV